MKQSINPWSLIAFRLLAGPALIAVAMVPSRSSAWISVVLLSLGVLSDIFDAITARLKEWRCDVPSVFSLGR